MALADRDKATFEVQDNYQKQTYRTRCYIYGANGKQLLNVPILNANSKQKTKSVLLDNSTNWQQQHLKSMASAYRSSPFYEFYIDDPRHFLKKVPKKYHVVAKASFDYRLTFEDVEEFSFVDKSPNDSDLLKYYNPLIYTEKRFFKHRIV